MRVVFTILIVVLFSSCLRDDPLNLPFSTFEPREIADGHVISTPGMEQMDSLALVDIYRRVFADDDFWSLRSLLVFRNGHLVSEAYLKDEEDVTQRHLIWSCTKQVLGVLVGIAMEEGLIEGLDDPVSDYFTSELDGHDDKAMITIRQLLTMQSGIDYENSGSGGETDQLLRQIPGNSVDFVLSLPMVSDPGTEFYYKDGDPHLLSAIIQKTAGQPTDSWADDVFFSRIGFENYNWVRYRDGITFGGFGIETTPRELAKVALCVADSGRWNTHQVVPEEWIAEMTVSQVDTQTDYAFGYYWWIDPVHDIHFMWGHGGQFAFVVPSKNIVVVMTSIPNTQGDYEIHADLALPIVFDIMETCD
ncbi:MAG: serine hydrolase [Bacteroidetes bacterium]|nr:serine hydrolase [Bacteroidota bacterium]